MDYKLQTPPQTPDRDKEVEAIEALKNEDLGFQIGFYHLVDGLMVYPEWHPTLRNQDRFKDLNTPFKQKSYISIKNVGALIDDRWKHFDLTHEQWVAHYTQTVLPYPSLIYLAHRAASDLGLSKTPRDLNFMLNSLWVRIFTQTEEGWQREVAGKQFVTNTDGFCSLANGDQESKHHIDFVSPLAGYQMKTPAFLRPTKNPGHLMDQRNNLRAQREWSEQNDLPVYYLVHDKGFIHKYSLEEAERMCGLQPAS